MDSLSKDFSGALKGVYISTYGCQMNVNDTERMFSLLEMINYAPVPSAEQAQLIIINSCSVREKPVHKVVSEVGRYKKLKMKNPDLKIGVAGCVAQQERGRLLKRLPLLDFVFGPDSIDELPEIVQKLDESKKPFHQTRLKNKEPYHIQTLIRNPKVTAFVNITKGCDNFCTFCIVPYTRGRERSRPIEHLLEDIKQLCGRGVKEVTLLGQNVNSYRSPCGAGFAELLKRLAKETPISRIRFTTSHPKDFDEELVSIIAEHRDKIMESIHLPVQSGNDEVLRRMNRGYTRKDYIEKVKIIFEKIPDAVLSTDIIVGFPGESEEQFKDTLSLLDEVPYEGIFAFCYSPRPFTKAALDPNPVPKKIQSERLKELNEKHQAFAFDLVQKYKGKVLDVLVEKRDEKGGLLTGRSSQNKLVYFSGPADLIGQEVPVCIEKAFPQTLYGRKI
ncbi:MAG: tRNA (N6-isopentenyl adenosine(37)-C2)-methylthiotransferase MiaB [Bdellovibrionales bacterium]|nr:tRNA (N6-isopentenyl adenosine(37)-C2)-methylthiotransferase MiaB [Bdellovibrionales bacterium]